MVNVKKKKKRLKRGVIVFVLAFIAVTIMTIGFALFDALLQINASAVVLPDGNVYISDVSIVANSLINATADPEITNDNTSVDFNLSFITINDSNATYSAQFDITLTNDSYNDYVYTSFDYPLTINRLSNGDEIESTYIQYSISGISPGDFIYAKQSVTFRVTFTFTNPFSDSTTDTFVINGEFAPTVHEETVAHILATLNEPTTLDLTGNNIDARISVHVINTYSYDKYFDITFDKGYYFVTDLRGNGLETQMIAANSEADFSFKIDRGVGYQFPFSVDRVTVYVTPLGDSSINAGRLTVYVDKTVELHDETPPTISNVQATIQDDNGSVKVEWDGTDVSNISNYIIKAMEGNNQVARVETGNDDEEIIITGLNKTGNAALQDTNYYFVVAGVDNSSRHNSGESYMSGANTDPGYASRSIEDAYRWSFTISYSGSTSYINFPSQATVLRKKAYDSPTFSVSDSSYTINANPTVTMVGGDITSSDYVFTRSNSNQSAQISIYAGVITGNVTINVTATGCLVEGTKILLANGKYKNIEDIDYSDLLAVYDHVNGGITYVYPLWIEESEESNGYKLITFDDGTILKTVNGHSLFNVDLKKYVNVDNKEEFNIGTKVYKIENNKLKVVKVKSIEIIKEKVKYYNIVSTSLYNVIANDLLTTDPTSSISNIYGFKDNAIYGDNYYKISNGDLLDYKDVSFIPYYLYSGLNLKNAKSLLNNSLDINFLENFIKSRTKSIYNKNGINYFYVSYSNGLDYKYNIYPEGSIYTLPINSRINCYYNTSDNKCYKPGERIIINHSMFFITR